MPDLQIRLFGALRASDGDRPIADLGSPRDQALWAYLLLHDDSHDRQRLSFLFWPDSSEAAARNRLRHAVYLLRRALPPSPVPWLIAGRETLRWNPTAPAWVDVWQFRAALAPLAQAEQGPPQVAVVEEAIALYRDDLLASFYDDIFAIERDRLRSLLFAGLEWLAGAYEANGEPGRARSAVSTLIARDPLREASYRMAMALLVRLGDRAGALQWFDRCRETLARELAVEPSPSTIELAERLQRATPPSVSPVRPALRRPTTPAVGLVPLVGRDAELAAVSEAITAAVRGEGRLILLAGEAGIGKTRLIAEAVDLAGGIETVLAGGGRETERLTPFFPVVEALRGMLGSGTLLAALDRVDPVWLAELARLLPELRSRRPDVPQPQPLDPTMERSRLFEGLTRCLLAIAVRPTLLVLDDLHWADEATLAWLEYFRRRQADAAVTIIAAYRTDDVSSGLAGLRSRLFRDGWDDEIAVGPLANDDLVQLLRELSGSRSLVGRLSRRLYEETDGNPLFIVETLRELIDAGIVQRDGGRWRLAKEDVPLPVSRTVREVIGARLARLSENARQLAGAASVLGHEIEFDVMAAVAGQNEGALLDALDELLAAQILAERAQAGAPRYGFSHEKIREVVYRDLSAARRSRLHARAGEAIAGRAVGPTSVAAQLARHFREAQRPADAAANFVIAADHALRSFAYAEACAALLEAIALLDGLGDEETIRRTRLLTRLKLSQAAFYVRPGELYDWLVPAEADAHALGDPNLEAAVALAQASALYIRGDFLNATVRLDSLLKTAERTGEPMLTVRARHLLGRIAVLRGESRRGRDLLLGDDGAGVMSESELLVSRDLAAAALSVLGEFEQAEADATAELARAEATGDPATVAAALVFLEAIYQHREDWPRTVEVGRAAIARARDAGNRIYEYDALIFLGPALAHLGDDAEALEAQQAGIEIARTSGIELLLGRALAWLTEIHRLAGRLVEARQAAEEGRLLAVRQGNPIEEGLNERVLAEIALDAGDYAAAEQWLGRAETRFATLEARVELGRAQTALARLQALVSPLARRPSAR
ncbi:MAG: AAA family ATPase [Dehalococcoidia bacterium]